MTEFTTASLDDLPWVDHPFENGQWHKIKTLGRAIFGKVYAASLPEDGGDNGLGLPEVFAVKQMSREAALGPSRGLENPRNDIRAALEIKALDLEYVIKVYGAWQDADSIYIATELCEHDVLTRLMNGGPGGAQMSTAEGVELVRQMVTGLAGLHRNGIAHRDFTLENILVTANGSVRIMDFGQAVRVYGAGRPEDERDMRTDQLGPPGKVTYLTPEFMRAILSRPIAIKNCPYTGTKLDAFQLGVAAFTIMVKSYPFNPKDTSLEPPKMTLDAIRAIAGEKGCLFPPCDDMCDRCTRLGDILDIWKARDRVPPVFLDLLERLMAPNKERRMTAIEALAHPSLRHPSPRALPAAEENAEEHEKLPSATASTTARENGLTTTASTTASRVTSTSGYSVVSSATMVEAHH